MPLFPGEDVKKTGHPDNRDATASLVKTREQRELERKRRQRELTVAAAAFAIMLVLMFFQLQYFGSGSALFFALFNLNVIILVGVLFVVLRNGMKLLLERRRRVIGSRLRTRLALAIAAMVTVPCLIMFVVTAQFVKLSVDFWFKNQVELSMDAALDVGRTMYESTGKRLQSQAVNTLAEIDERRYTWGGNSMDAFLERKRGEYRLSLIGVLGPDKTERNWHPLPEIGNAWQGVKETVNWDEVLRHKYRFFMGRGLTSDFMFGVLAVDDGQNGYIVLGESMGPSFQQKMDRVTSGASEYKQLNSLKRPLKSMLYVTLSVLTALIALGAVWFAFKVSREMVSPIMALVGATEQLAKGDTDVHLEDSSSDELGILITAFNRMADEIGTSRRELTDTNALLGQQNLVLDQQRRYVETVLDNIAAGVLSFDSGWIITTANKAACQILDKSLEELLGTNVADIIPQYQHELLTQVRNDFSSRPLSIIQISLNKDSEEKRLMATTVALSGMDGEFQGAVAVFEDITEMERMQRMAAWREVARRIAHEIKNPLTPIKLSAQRLEKKFGSDIEDQAFHQSTQLIVRQVEQIQTMVQEFSAFAKLPESHLRRGRLEPILEDTVNMFRNSHARIQWTLELEPNLPGLELDNDAMSRAFINILTNAAEALDGVDKPRVRVRAAYKPEHKIIRVDVEDNGPDGLTDEERTRLFEPYFSRKKGGTGLGLTIVKSVVTEHRGYVRAARTDDGGTAITVELPIAS